jgi:hypothetical protein
MQKSVFWKRGVVFLSWHVPVQLYSGGTVGRASVTAKFTRGSECKFTIDIAAEKSVEMVTFSTFSCYIRMFTWQMPLLWRDKGGIFL